MIGGFLKSVAQLPFQVTAPFRRLPDFLLIGAQKSGTTSLFHYLMEHPEVAVNPRRRKEMYFFNKDYEKGMSFYRRYFPLNYVEGLVGEGSTVYLHTREVPERVAASLPDIRLVAVLREPAARAVSHYYHHVQRGREQRPIDEAFAPALMKRWRGGDLEDGLSFRYLNNGYYVEHLRNWLKYFSREQLCIVQSEEMFLEPQRVYQHICRFLGLSDSDLTSETAHNAGEPRKNEPDILNALYNVYADSVRELRELNLGDFNWKPYV